MKRYIRTKDGIYEPDGESYDKLSLLVKYKGGKNYLSKKEPILKEADTIRELLDFECWECKKPKQTIVIPIHYEYTGISPYLRDVQIYGAIHVEGKGIIYVAKRDKKGEFELLW